MRIGIDATALPARRLGAANYTICLTSELLKASSADQFVIFTKPAQAGLFGAAPNATIVPVRLPTRTYRLAWEQLALPRLARRYRLDLLHSPHYTVPLALECPSVVTIHDMTFFLFPRSHQLYRRLFFRAMIPRAARRANAIITPSVSTRTDLLRLLGVAENRVRVVLHGVTPDFRPILDCSASRELLARYGIQTPYLLYVGNLEPRKNLPRLLRAFGELLQEEISAWLVLVGTRGWMNTPIGETVRTLRLGERVRFTGYVEQEDLPTLYSRAAGFVYPSLYEGFGFPVLEAMACGVPVVTSNTSSMAEIAGEAALLVDPFDASALAQALGKVLRDPRLAGDLGRRGLARAREFTWSRTATGTLEVYREAVGGV
jgi:glycosyltransferase involved in cell wall biosynthesis